MSKNIKLFKVLGYLGFVLGIFENHVLVTEKKIFFNLFSFNGTN